MIIVIWLWELSLDQYSDYNEAENHVGRSGTQWILVSVMQKMILIAEINGFFNYLMRKSVLGEFQIAIQFKSRFSQVWDLILAF